MLRKNLTPLVALFLITIELVADPLYFKSYGNILTLSLKCKNATTSASCGWIALLGVLSFLFIFLCLYFLFCVFWRLFWVLDFCSVYFFVIGLLNNCLGYEKLFWVWKIALSSLFDYFSNALSHFLYMGNYKWDIIQLNVILIVVLKKSRCFPFFFR